MLPAAASAAGPPGSIPFTFKVPAKGHETVYGLQVVGHLPTGTTMSGGVPVTVTATNRAKIAKGVLSAAVVFPVGKLTWDVFVVIDGSKEVGGGAPSITGNVSLPPLPNLTVTEVPIGAKGCEKVLNILHKYAASLSGETKLAGAAYLLWLFTGPSDSAKATVAGAACK